MEDYTVNVVGFMLKARCKCWVTQRGCEVRIAQALLGFGQPNSAVGSMLRAYL